MTGCKADDVEAPLFGVGETAAVDALLEVDPRVLELINEAEVVEEAEEAVDETSALGE